MTPILPDGTHKRARLFSALQSHYLFQDRCGRPGKGNDKGSIEALVGFARRDFMVPVPRFATWAEFNAYLEAQCRKRQEDILPRHKESIGGRLQRELAVMTRIVAEHQNVETEIDGVLSRLSQRATEKAEDLEAGRGHEQ